MNASLNTVYYVHPDFYTWLALSVVLRNEQYTTERFPGK